MEVEDFLEHHGVKGMKWGRRTKHTESRKAYKTRVAGERQAHDQAHLKNVLATSMKKGENVLIKTQLPGDYAHTVMTGKQFIEMAGKGALLSAKTTDVFATLDPKAKQFVLNEKATPVYKPSARR